MLAHHYPDVPNVGDFTKIAGDEFGTVDLIVGGTPCQDFSIAGLRAGLGGARGALTVEYVRLVERIRPRWCVWENVPGVLSADGGRAFGILLGALAQRGYGFAYRVLDAQYYHLAQRRKRVYVVGYLGDWRPPLAALFDEGSLSWDSEPLRDPQEEVAAPLVASAGKRGGFGSDGEGLTLHATAWRTFGDGGVYEEGDVSAPLTTMADHGSHLITYSLRADASRAGLAKTPSTDAAGVVRLRDPGFNLYEDVSPTLDTSATHTVLPPYAEFPRRYSVLECERLQGFPDHYTAVRIGRAKRIIADTSRRRMLGNAMPVNVVEEIGRRIALVEEVLRG